MKINPVCIWSISILSDIIEVADVDYAILNRKTFNNHLDIKGTFIHHEDFFLQNYS